MATKTVDQSGDAAVASVEWDLECKLTQLRSLLTSMYGVGADWLEQIGQEHRDNLLWIASDLANEVDVLRVRASEARHVARAELSSRCARIAQGPVERA